jgi:predicted lipoprotein with Yx(FWY)xxD motif
MRKIFYLFFFFSSNHVLGQWSTDSTTNNPISVATANQINPQIVTDSSGGAAIVWQDARNGNNDIYMQLISSTGEIQWAVDGIAVCTATGSQSNVQIINAGEGHYIIAWQDNRNNLTTSNDIYAQLISSDGTPQWTTDGVVVCEAPGSQITPKIRSDGNGGAIIVWQDSRNGGADINIYAQRIDATGTALWTADGIAVCSATGSQSQPQIVSDNDGGVVITWTDERNGNSDIYAQRIASDGTNVWSTTDGELICGETSMQFSSQLATDGNGGAIIAWNDTRNPTSLDIYAQYVNASGVVQWTPADGVVIATAVNDQVNPKLLADGSGGAFIVWEDGRSGDVDVDLDGFPDTDIYAQKINNMGTVEWAADGIPISLETGDQITPQLISDGSNGAIITWSDARFGAANDIYAQRINSTGDAQWAANGTALSSAGANQLVPQLVASGGGAIVTWQDGRAGATDNNIYAARLSALGTLPVTALTFYGKQTDTGNLLYWTTATEQNNLGFNVERSADGINFNTIGFTEGRGNSSVWQSYSFTDKLPLNHKNYYRLKQMDRDGKFTYSAIILLQAAARSTAVSMFPNPASGKINITIQTNRSQKIQWQLLNNKGQLIKQGNWQLTQGSTALPAIDISAIASGIYYLKLNGSSIQQVTKLIKQ